VIAWVVEPTSLLDTGRVLTDLSQAPASYATKKRTLVRAGAKQYRDKVAAACFEHASTRGDISLVLYDVTTLYVEAEKEDDLRKVAGHHDCQRTDRGELVNDHSHPPLNLQLGEQLHQFGPRTRSNDLPTLLAKRGRQLTTPVDCWA